MKTLLLCLSIVWILASCHTPETVLPPAPPHDPWVPSSTPLLTTEARFGGTLHRKWRAFKYRTDFYIHDTLSLGTDSLVEWSRPYIAGLNKSTSDGYEYEHFFTFREDETFFEESGPYFYPHPMWPQTPDHKWQNGTFIFKDERIVLQDRKEEYWQRIQNNWVQKFVWNHSPEGYQIQQFSPDTLSFVSKYYLDPGFEEPFRRPATYYQYHYILVPE